ncbi:MAG: inositol monophosphatase [Leptospiraceae bacterium]|nr:inositol monophosphatase [Leptospiraceae bacterium]
MYESPIAEFPFEEIQKRMDLLKGALPALGQRLLQIQPQLHIENSANSKSDLTLMNRADEEIEGPLLTALHEAFPDDTYYAEMEDTEPNHMDFTWWIDAVDGTRNFIHGLPFFCMSVGLVFRETPVAGVVYVPAMGEMYHAISGSGAFKNDQPISVSRIAQMERSLVATGLPYERKEIITRLISDISAFVSSGTGLRRTGSVILDLCYVAEGRFDAMWERDVDPWDSCAASVLIKEAGGRVSGFAGEIYDVKLRDIVASNGILHTEMLEILKQAREIEGIN